MSRVRAVVWGDMLAAGTVLVVDDEHYIVDLLADLLEEEGYRVRRAYDGVAALALVEGDAPDLIIADVMMPRLDGLALVSRVHAQKPALPVILMSAATVDPGRPGVRFIAKPFDIDQVLDTVAQAIHLADAADRAAAPTRKPRPRL